QVGTARNLNDSNQSPFTSKRLNPRPSPPYNSNICCEGVSSSRGMTLPVTIITSSRANGATKCSTQSGVAITSSSGAMAIAAVLATKPVLRAYANPLRGSSTSTTPGNSATTGGVCPDDGLLSTTTISIVRGDIWVTRLCKHSRRSFGRSSVATTTETDTSGA